MKYILTLLFCSSALLGYSQYNAVVADTNDQWLLYHEIFDGAQPELFTINGAITIDSNVYYEIIDYDENVLGFVKQDSTNAKLWWRNFDSNEDILIMDLELEVGDTFDLRMSPSYIGTPGDKIVVTDIDTINDRKTIVFDYHIGGGYISEQFSFIEGVGPNAGLIYAVYGSNAPFLCLGYLVCRKENSGNILYAWNEMNPEICGPINGSTQSVNENTIKFIFYSSENILVADWATKENIHLVVYNSLGQEMYKDKLKNRMKLHADEGFTGHLFYGVFENGYVTQSGRVEYKH